MRNLFSSTLLVFVAGFGASAASYSTNFVTPAGLVPDGDLNGLVDARVITGWQGVVSHVSVNLNISGGFNGDLYVYLYHRDPSLSAASAILLNRVGVSSASDVGYPNSGFGSSFTLDDTASHDVHFYQTFSYTLSGNTLSGSWQPDGRAVDPLSPGVSLESTPRTSMLSLFNGMDPNGEWALYVADVAAGYESTLNDWTLQIQTIPEPSASLLIGLSCLAGGIYWRLKPLGFWR